MTLSRGENYFFIVILRGFKAIKLDPYRQLSSYTRLSNTSQSFIFEIRYHWDDFRGNRSMGRIQEFPIRKVK